MARLNLINSLDEELEHMNDNYTNQGYQYEHNLLKNVVSQEMFVNPINDVPMRQIERLIESLINEVRQIKLFYAFAFPKYSKNIN